ncbi:iron transporter FeoA [Streptomyces sp. NRRL F-4489]|nr:iron transporter FeoA [Streptomyces sp. NRRL F-4489]
MEPGSRATVVEVVVDGEPEITRRLHDLGFTPGTVVEVVRRAPLRDPVVYRVKDYEVCLRRAQAARIRTTGAVR